MIQLNYVQNYLNGLFKKEEITGLQKKSSAIGACTKGPPQTHEDHTHSSYIVAKSYGIGIRLTDL